MLGRWGETHGISVEREPLSAQSVYRTTRGTAFFGDSFDMLNEGVFNSRFGQVQLVFTSPPFPLNTKKSYGNLRGEDYIDWLADFAPLLRNIVSDDGSIVIEIGNAWLPGEPVMATHVMEAFLRFLKEGDLHLCQEFIWYNPARLPSPVQWVNKERIRVKDAFTKIWWMSPTPRPKADNRKVLNEYSSSMRKLIKTGRYNSGRRPSEHNIGKESFSADNRGAIPPNVGGAEMLPMVDRDITPSEFAKYLETASNLLKAANTISNDEYRKFCIENEMPIHPARMPATMVDFFIKFLTDEGDLVFDPFSGSNTTGKAAEILNRNWISIDKDWNYVTSSIGRFDPTEICEVCSEIEISNIQDRTKEHSKNEIGENSIAQLVNDP